MAGQYMDRPDASVVAKHVGTSHHGAEEDAPALLLLPSLTFTIQYFKIRLWYPFINATMEAGAPLTPSSRQQHASNERSRKDKTYSATSSSTAIAWIDKIYHQSLLIWYNHGPGSQLLLVVFVAVMIVWSFVVSSPARESRTYALNIATGAEYTEEETEARGAYAALEPVSWAHVFLLMSAGTTLACIMWYGRILLPIPDLVAGSNVLKAVRNEARGNISAKSKNPKPQSTQYSDMAWNEQFKSISTENRFRLFAEVALLRTIDAGFVCGVLARTRWICRATGHCPNSPTWGELSRILYRPREITDNSHVSLTFASDIGSIVVIFTSIVVITTVLLLAQLATLEKSYLAIMGYISGEWKLVSDASAGGSNNVPSPWDSRRRYKKGDYIVYSYPGFPPSIYMATSNSPEGRPFDLSLRVTHDLFRQDLGHVSTSMVISYCASIHNAFMAGIFMIGLYYTIQGANTSALVTAFMANLIASFGLVHVGLMDYNELQSIAAEVNGN